MSQLSAPSRSPFELIAEACGRLPDELRRTPGRLLAGELEPSWAAIQEFLGHNELELALEVLVDLGHRHLRRDEHFWDLVSQAADLLEA